jgi:hypothetical protein
MNPLSFINSGSVGLALASMAPKKALAEESIVCAAAAEQKGKIKLYSNEFYTTCAIGG